MSSIAQKVSHESCLLGADLQISTGTWFYAAILRKYISLEELLHPCLYGANQ